MSRRRRARSASARAWFLDPYWEVLRLDCGDAILNHMQGRYLRVRSPDPAQDAFLDALGRAIDSPQDPWSAVVLATGSATPLAKALAAEGAVHPASRLTPRDRLPAEEFRRFRSFLAWLGQFSGEPFGSDAFSRLRGASVALIGLGGAGSFCAMMLAACGVGRLVLVDGDVVSHSNLVRQVFFTAADADAGVSKVAALAARIAALSPYTKAVALQRRIATVEEATHVVRGCHLAILTADQPRIVINRIVNAACVVERVPLIYAFVGMVGPMFVPGVSACFECVERSWRCEIGDDHDAIVAGLRRRATAEYPSMVTGPSRVAEVMVEEAIGLITGAYAPYTLGRVCSVGKDQPDRTILRDPNCASCGAARQRRRP